MSDSRLNLTGLTYFFNKLKQVFATQAALNNLSDRVDDIVAEGGEPNVIDSISVNGTAVSPDADKNVDLSVATFLNGAITDGNEMLSVLFNTPTEIEISDGQNTLTFNTADIPTATSDLTNDGDGNSPFATQAYVGQNGGKIDTISVNGTQQTITNKNVDITVPTKVSDLTNDGDGTTGSTFPTTAQMQTAIDAKISSAYKVKGSVAFANLPSLTAANEGNVYDVTDSFTTTADFVEDAGKTYPAGTNVVIINKGTEQSPVYKYDVLAGFVDLSNYWNSTNLTAITTAEIDAMMAS